MNLDDWSVQAAAEFVFHSARGDDGSRLSYTVESENMTLRIGDRPGLFWPQVMVGDRVVDVAGEQAILQAGTGQSPILFWQPSDGVYASVQGSGDAERLLEIAQTIAPVPADDARLQEAWFTRTP